MVEVYPSGTGVKDEVGVGVGGKRVDGNTSVGVFEDEVDEALCGGGCGLVGVGVDVAGDDGGGGAIAGKCECGGVIRVVVDAQSCEVPRVLFLGICLRVSDSLCAEAWFTSNPRIGRGTPQLVG